MKNRDLSTLKYVILGTLFMVTAVITFISMNYQSASPATTTMTEATLPIVMMQTSDGTLFNQLHGYTCDMDESLFNDSITPLPTDKKLPIVIDTYSQNITGVSYKVRDLNDMSLIENTVVKDYTSQEGRINATLNIKNLIEDNTEYLLEVNISTSEHESISYYTKIISAKDYKLQDKLNFVLEFNKNTLEPGKLSGITKYLETNSSGNNTNFGKVNINSSQAQIGWGSLNPFVESTVVPTVSDINSEVAVITLDYEIGLGNSHDAYDTCKVNEYYRVRQSGSTMYLLNYEREANQLFDSRNDLTSNAKINLGIQADTSVTMRSSDDNNYTYFVNQGTLWSYDGKNNVFTKTFSFDEDDSDHVRERYNEHEIKIIDVNKNGDCDFLVSGYMNRGAHEGQVGVSLYSYNFEKNVVTERLFIPMNIPYEIISENVGGVAYISNNNVFYVLVDDTLYAVDLTSKEVMTEVTGLKEGNYAVSSDGKAIAYSESGDEYNSDTIRILNMEKGTSNEFKADLGDKLKPIGYINTDFIYGVAHQSDILIDNNGTVTFPMYKVDIVNSEYQQIKEYSQDGIYVSDASVSNLRVNLSRVVKDASGDYESTTMDQLINKDEGSNATGVTSTTIATADRLQEVVIALPQAAANADGVSMKSTKEVVFNQGEALSINTDFSGDGRYYVYGYGKFQGSYTVLASAIAKAYDTYGTVLNYHNDYIWKRYKDTNASVKGLSASGVSGDDSLTKAVGILMKYAALGDSGAAQMDANNTAISVLNKATGNKALNLKGLSLDKVLYMIDAGYPVLGRTGANTYVVISAYDSNNIAYLDGDTGASKTMSIADATKLFAQWGNTFISYYK